MESNTVLKKNDNEPSGLITNIQKYTIHDGPGIRTAVFFKGCSLKCIWCSNPETVDTQQQIGVYPSKCLSLKKCGYCLKSCPAPAPCPIGFDENGLLKSVRMIPECIECFICDDVCPSRAIKTWGERMSVSELIRIITEDRSFYDRSGGGVTLTGGEVMLQWEFAALLLKSCKDEGINTCVESALNCAREYVEAVYEFADLVIADIKHMDTSKHRLFTGAGNEQILDNIKRTTNLGKKLVLRTPVVIGYNSDEANIRATGAFIRDELGGNVAQYQLLPYRKLGTEKYDSLGREYPMGDYAVLERETWEREIRRLADLLFNEYGIPTTAGTGQRLRTN